MYTRFTREQRIDLLGIRIFNCHSRFSCHSHCYFWAVLHSVPETVEPIHEQRDCQSILL